MPTRRSLIACVVASTRVATAEVTVHEGHSGGVPGERSSLRREVVLATVEPHERAALRSERTLVVLERKRGPTNRGQGQLKLQSAEYDGLCGREVRDRRALHVHRGAGLGHDRQ